MNTEKTPVAEAVVAMLPVSTVALIASPGFEPVTCGTRETTNKDGTKNEVPADQRTRSIVIPELAVPDVPSKFTMFVLDALRTTAKKQLATMWKEEPMLREVPASIWSVDSLLLFAAREAESKRLTKAGVELWFDNSQLCALLMKKGDAKLLAKWKGEVLGLSAPALVYSEQKCATIMATIKKNADDAASEMGVQMIAKLQKRIDNLKREAEEVGLEIPELDD